MEIKARLKKPFTIEEKMMFLIENNDTLGYEIVENDKELLAMGYTEEEKREQEQEEIRKKLPMMNMTKLDFVTSLESYNVTYEAIKVLLSKSPEAQKQWDLCERIYRFNELLEPMASQFGITPEQLDEIFITKGVM